MNLIARTTTTSGLKGSCRLDHRRYLVGLKISDEGWAKIKLLRNVFHGDWNYILLPHLPTSSTMTWYGYFVVDTKRHPHDESSEVVGQFEFGYAPACTFPNRFYGSETRLKSAHY